MPPRLRHTPDSHGQASQPYGADRIAGIVDTTGDYRGIGAQIVAVDFVLMLAQFFQIDDQGAHLSPGGPPMPREQAAAVALNRIVARRGRL